MLALPASLVGPGLSKGSDLSEAYVPGRDKPVIFARVPASYPVVITQRSRYLSRAARAKMHRRARNTGSRRRLFNWALQILQHSNQSKVCATPSVHYSTMCASFTMPV